MYVVMTFEKVKSLQDHQKFCWNESSVPTIFWVTFFLQIQFYGVIVLIE